jgi:hypothetical protein
MPGAVATNRGLLCHPAVEACDAMGYGPEQPIEAQAACLDGMIVQIREDRAADAERRARISEALHEFGRSMNSTNRGATCVQTGRIISCY